MKVSNWAIDHSVTIFVLMFVLGVAGWSAYNSLPREASPDITIPFVMVTTPYFGVSPADIETLITNPIEEELEQLKDVQEIRSTSAEGASIVSIEFEPTIDIDVALQNVRERVDAAQPELPADAEDPIITEISFSEFPIMVVNISGEMGLLRLKSVAEDLQDDIESIPGVLEVALTGGLEREIAIEADPDLLSYYRVSLDELTRTIQGENLNMPGGSVDVGELKYLVRVPSEFEDPHEIESLVIREEYGQPIYVRDVAEVVDGYEDQETYSRINGVQSVSLSITRRAGENIIRITDEIKELVEEYQHRYGESVDFAVLADVSDDIRVQLHELENNIITGLILVAVVLLFFMGGLRNALFVAIAIPGSMLISFYILQLLGVTLNIVVLFSLVLALGMLVDNAIVIVENIYRHATMGKSRIEAAKDGVAEVAWPVIASTATTVFAFFPLMFWPGIMGEFMYFLPLTVVIVLASSLFVALIINPVICAVFLRIPKKDRDRGPVDEMEAIPNNLLYRAYGGTLRFAVNNRWVVGVVTMVVFIGTFMLYGQKNAGVEFFPTTTPETFFVNVTLPDGSNVEASDRIMRQVERILSEEENIDRYVADVGAGNGNQMDFGSGGTAPHRSQVTVELVPVEDQTENAFDTIAGLREEFSSITGADFEIVAEEGGPPTAAPINIEIVGNDTEVIDRLVSEIMHEIRDIPGVVNLQDDFGRGRSEITVRVDREAVSDLGISTWDVADTVRTAVNGTPASTFRDGTDEYDIVVRLIDEARDSIEDIEALTVKLESGEHVPITTVAEVRTEAGFGSIRHVDGDRVVTISGDVADGFNANEILLAVQAMVDETVEIPAGYEVRYTGESQDQEEAQAFLGEALLTALFLIALVLITQFNSVLQPFIILCSVLLSILGVLWILMLRGLPFNIIMTGVGIISLAGVVVNNAIVLIDYINQLKERGLGPKEAVIQAGLVRFRPVLLTAVTTMLSLMPTVLGYSIDFRTMSIATGGTSVEMWGPMANAVVAGLAVATVLTLVVVPTLYSTFDSFSAWMSRLFGRSEEPALATANGAPASLDSTPSAPPAESAPEPEPESAPEPEPAREPEPQRPEASADEDEDPESSIPGMVPSPAE